MRSPLLRREDGFTMIELMIVVLIIGVLIAIALPTYLGAREQAANRATQADMRTGLAAALAFYSQTRDWDGFDPAQGEAEEPRLEWVGPGAPALGQVSVHVHADDDLLLVGLSASGTYFCVAQIAASPATSRGAGAAFADVDTTGECTGGW